MPSSAEPSGWLAVVTAAGQAKRFRPFSTLVPKEMLPIGAQPAVEHTINECLRGGARHVIVVTRPDDPVVPAYVDRLARRGMPVEVVPEDPSHGYGNAAGLLTLEPRLREEPMFAVAFGDEVMLGGIDLAAMYATARAGAEAVVAGRSVDSTEDDSHGVIDLYPDSTDRVAGIRQRTIPASVTEPLAVPSRLFLRPSVLDLLAPSEHARGEIDLGVAVSELARVADVRAHRVGGNWITVGDPCRYLHALDTYWRLAET